MEQNNKHHALREHTMRYAKWVTRGAPPCAPHLNAEWHVAQLSDVPNALLHAENDPVRGPSRNVYAAMCTAPGVQLTMRHDGIAWLLEFCTDEDEQPVVLAKVKSPSLHPATVGSSMWALCIDGEWRDAPDFEMATVGPNTEEHPYLMEELGLDFFMRVQTTRRVVWFECPATGNVYHSAAKPGGLGGRSKPGKRFCSLCSKCFSANNFQSQHLSNLHRPSQPFHLRATRDKDVVHLAWDPPSQGVDISGYRVNFSLDSGRTWRTAIDDTLTPRPEAVISNLSDGVGYCFTVAALNFAGHGPETLATAPLLGSESSLSGGLDLLSMAAANVKGKKKQNAAAVAAAGACAVEAQSVVAHSSVEDASAADEQDDVGPRRSVVSRTSAYSDVSSRRKSPSSPEPEDALTHGKLRVKEGEGSDGGEDDPIRLSTSFEVG